MQEEKLDYSPGSSRRIFNNEDACVNFIKKANASSLQMIIERSSVDPQLKEFCYSNELDVFWKSVLNNPNKLGLNIRVPALMPQVNLHAFDFIGGLYFYAKACAVDITAGSNHSKKWQLMLKAAQLGSIHAFVYVSNCNIITLKKISEGKSQSKLTPKMMVDQAKVFANLYGTPGFMLLAYDYVCIANCNIQPVRDILRDIYSMALQSAYTAKYLEPHCQAAIHNACFGKGIVALHLFGVKDVESLIRECRTKAGHFIEDKDVPDIQRKALYAAKEFKENCIDSLEIDVDTITQSRNFSA